MQLDSVRPLARLASVGTRKLIRTRCEDQSFTEAVRIGNGQCGGRLTSFLNRRDSGPQFFEGSISMLVLSRKVNEKIVVTSPDGTLITLMLVEIRGDKARIGVDAPKSWSIHRAEIQALVDAE